MSNAKDDGEKVETLGRYRARRLLDNFQKQMAPIMNGFIAALERDVEGTGTPVWR
jgi:hypothetical protein